MLDKNIAVAQKLLTTSPVPALIADKKFTPIWYNAAYKKGFPDFKNIDKLLNGILEVEKEDADLFMFHKVFIPIKTKIKATGEYVYLTKFSIFGGERFIISLTAENKWVDKNSYSEHFFKEAFLMMPIPVILFNFGTGKIKYVNSGFVKICGVPPEHILNMPLESLFPDGRDTIKEYISRSEPYTKPFLINAVQIDNKKIVLEVSPFVFNEHGNVMVVFNVQDITKHVSNKLDILNDDSEELALLLKASSEGVVVTEDKKIININSIACSMWGYEKNELIGTHLSVLIEDDNSVAAQTSKHKPETIYTARNKDGRTFKVEKISKYLFAWNRHLLINVFKIHKDEILGIKMGSVSPKMLEKAVLYHQPNFIIVYDKSFNIISCNKAILDFFSCGDTESFKEKYNDYYKLFLESDGYFTGHQSGKDWFLKSLDNNLMEYSVALSKPDTGEEHIFLLKSSHVNDEEAAYVVSLSDITETAQRALVFKDANTLLADKADDVVEELRIKEELLVHQQKLATMGEMLSIITHQWKQPLNAVGILAQQIDFIVKENENCPEGTEISEMISSIMEHVTFMAETTDNFKDFLKNSNQLNYFSIRRAIISTIKILNITLSKNNVTIDYSLDETCEKIMVEGHLNDFKQVILNVVANSRDAIIAKRHKCDDNFEGKIIIETFLKDDNIVELTIRDNGIGIPTDAHEKVFTRYYTTKADSGMGLGMYISRLLINKMNGSIVSNNWENGAIIKILLPISGIEK